MTFRMALKFIRRNAPETEQTFRAICRNRYCRPVRDWAIFDLITGTWRVFTRSSVSRSAANYGGRSRCRRGSGAMAAPQFNNQPKGTRR